jgi:hypothetical protein
MLAPKSMKRGFNEAGSDGKNLIHIFEIAMSLAFMRFVEAIVQGT